MIKTQFKDQLEFDIYIAQKKTEMEKGYLTCSERKQIKNMLDKNYKPYFIKETPKKVIKPLITNYKQLRRACEQVKKEDNIAAIIQELKDSLSETGGLGLSANQIGYSKRISYIKIPVLNKEKKLEIKEMILINPKIVEKSRPYIVRGEGCLSFPNLRIDTDRFVFITLINHNEKLEPSTILSQDLEALTIQHEIDHHNGITIIERKHKK